MNWNNFFGLEKRNVDKGLDYVSTYSDGLLFGKLSTKSNAMGISSVFAAVNLIANTIAMLPVIITSKVDNKKNRMDNHNLNYIFGDRNTANYLSKFNLFKQIIQSVILRGNAFCYIERANSGEVMNVRFLEASDVIIYYSKERNLLYYDCPIVSKKHIEPCNMLHFVLHSYDGIQGVSLLNYAARTLGITNASENSAKNFFENGMNVNGIIKVNTPISAKQKEEIKQSWTNTYGNGGGGLAVINANMDYQQLQLSPEDSQLLSSRQFNVSDIARFFNIDPSLIGGDGKVSYSSLEQIQQAFLCHTLQPYISMIENELNRKLLLPSEEFLKIELETNELLRVNKQAQADYYTKMVSSGIMSINEVRNELGYNNIEDGDKHFIAYSSTEKNEIGGNGDNSENNDNNNKE